MFVTGKIRQKLEKQLGKIRRTNGRGYCWICGSLSGVKMSREGYAVRCKRCISKEQTSEAVKEFEKIKASLDK